MRKKFFLFISFITFICLGSCFETNDNYKDIRLDYDAKNYTALALDDWYSVEVSNDASYDYVYIKITLNIENYNEFKYNLYVNETKIDKKDFSISENVITYKVKDSNWSPIY